MQEADKPLEEFNHTEIDMVCTNSETEIEEVTSEKDSSNDEGTTDYDDQVCFYKLSPIGIFTIKFK